MRKLLIVGPDVAMQRSLNVAPNLLNRGFHADAPNRGWAGDRSYVLIRKGWFYLAVILDQHSRRVIDRAVSNRVKRELAVRALNMAIALWRPLKGCIHDTDRVRSTCLRRRVFAFSTFSCAPYIRSSC